MEAEDRPGVAIMLPERIAWLHDLLDQTIAQIAGADGRAAVAIMRELERAHATGGRVHLDELAERIQGLTELERRVLARGVSILLDLMNVAEDRQRVRVLREREQAAFPGPRAESIRAAVTQLATAGCAPAQLQRLLSELDLELVFTAHPTEAKRRSIRSKLRRVRELLQRLDGRELLPREAARLETQLRAELTKLWQTDFIRPWPPTVMQEVQRGLSIAPVLWDVVPAVCQDLREAVCERYPLARDMPTLRLRFASWMGGDRDGHPGVTTAITAETLDWLRRTAVALHRETCCDLFGALSLSRRQAPISEELPAAVAAAERTWPVLSERLAVIPPNETYRRWIVVIDWRLGQAGQVRPGGEPVEGAYASAHELEQDVLIIQRSLLVAQNELLAGGELQRWLDQIRTFGLHLARLDVRQDARYYESVIGELLAIAGGVTNYAALTEPERQQALLDTLGRPVAWPQEELSAAARETLELVTLLQRTLHDLGPEALGTHIISMAHQPSDVLSVLWLWRWANATVDAASTPPARTLPIVPLFETIDFLAHAGDTVAAMLDCAEYRRQLAEHGDCQIVMLGYSDSTKDGGYLAASWAAYRAQVLIERAATPRGVRVTFFHGRGGSLGRGGGPAARSILSLPPQTFRGALRITEQGEVLADRYDDPQVAYRHLEQVTWSALLAGSSTRQADPQSWEDTMQWLTDQSLRAYHDLVRRPGFVDFFRRATPIEEIVQLPIGSRPARRKAGGSLSDLRAIPWVFSWTQIRCLVPAWYGLGDAVEKLRAAHPDQYADLAMMYREWPFFRALIDNAGLALAKTDPAIVTYYVRLAGATAAAREFGGLIEDEFRRSRDAVLAITEQEELLADVVWLRESIRRRGPYVDVLNLIQVDLLARIRAAEQTVPERELDEWEHLVRLSIKGIAAGMRTTG